MDDDFLEPATRAVLTMVATLLFHHSEGFNELHEILEENDKVRRKFGTDRKFGEPQFEDETKKSSVSFKDGGVQSQTVHSEDSSVEGDTTIKTAYEPSMIPQAAPITDSAIDRMVQSQTFHYEDSEADDGVLMDSRVHSPMVRQTVRITDSAIDRMTESQTVHLDDSPEQAPSMVQRNEPAQQNLSPARDTLDDLVESRTINLEDSYYEPPSVGDANYTPDDLIPDWLHQVPDSSFQQSEQSFRLPRPKAPIRQSELRNTPDLYRSYTAPPQISMAQTPPRTHALTPQMGVRRKPPVSRLQAFKEASLRHTPPPGNLWRPGFDDTNSTTPTPIQRSTPNETMGSFLDRSKPSFFKSPPLSPESEASFRITRPFRSDRRRDRSTGPQLHRSYVASPSALTTNQTPRRQQVMSPAVNLDSISFPDGTLPSFARSPAIPESEVSYQIPRPTRSVRRLRRGRSREPNLYASYGMGTIPSPVGPRSVQRSLPTENLDSVHIPDASLPSYYDSPRTPGAEPSYRIARRDGSLQRRRGRNVPSDMYRSYVADRTLPQAAPRRIPMYSPADTLDNVEFPNDSLLQFGGSPSIGPRQTPRTPQRTNHRGDRNFNMTVEDLENIPFPELTLPSLASTTYSNFDSRRFPDLSQLPPDMLNVSRGTTFPSYMESRERFREQSGQENLEDYGIDFAPEFDSTGGSHHGERSIPMHGGMDETLNTLFTRINRQAEIIQAGGRPTERQRIGLMRRSSDDYDFETGRMRN